MRRQPSLRRGGARRARAVDPTRPSSSTTTTSTSRRASCARRGPTRRSRTSSTSRGRRPTTGTCCPLDARRAIHEGLLANDVVGFHTARWRRNFLRCCEDFVGASADCDRGTLEHDGRTVHVSANPISVDPDEFDELAESPAVLAAERRARVGAPGEAHPARRPHRSVEERRPRLPRVRALPRRASRDARPREDARAARSLAAGHPRVRRVPRRDPARGARASTTASQRDGWLPIDLHIEDDFAAVGRGVQAVRRAARERDLRRAEPRREGGAARERARRRARPLRERRRARGARRLGAHGQPVRRRGPGRGDPPRRSRWTGGGAAAADRGDPRTVREHDVAAWIDAASSPRARARS